MKKRLYKAWMNVWLHWRTVRLVYVTARIERKSFRVRVLLAAIQLFTARFMTARFDYKSNQPKH